MDKGERRRKKVPGRGADRNRENETSCSKRID